MSNPADEIFWTKSSNDWCLLGRWRATGSRPALTELVARHVGLVYGICRRRMRDRELAEEVSRDVFQKLAQSGPPYRPGQLLSGWLMQIAHRRCDAMLRATPRRQVPLAGNLHGAPDDDSIARWRSDDDVLGDLDLALAAVSRADRDVLLNRYYHGRKLRELSAELGISQNAAAMRLTRAMSRVRRRLATQGRVTLDAALIGSTIAAIGHEPVARPLVAGIRAAATNGATAPASQRESLRTRATSLLSQWRSKLLGFQIAAE